MRNCAFIDNLLLRAELGSGVLKLEALKRDLGKGELDVELGAIAHSVGFETKDVKALLLDGIEAAKDDLAEEFEL